MIPFLDLKAQYQSIKREIDEAVLNVVASAQYVLGEEVARFEDEFATYCNVEHAIAVNSGTSALHLALLTAGVGPGDEVITVPSTFVATVSAICYTGATPVLVDVEPVSMTMDPARLAQAISPRTKAIVPVHLYGQMADMDPIMAIADAYGIAVIEDACQAHGAEYRKRRAGSIGTSGCFSFYPGKNLGACGEAGMVVTNDPEQAATMRMLRDWGQKQRYHHHLKGFNYRMDTIQGAVLRVKLRHLEDWTEARRAHASRYNSLLQDFGSVSAPMECLARRHVYHVYSVRCQDRERTQKQLTDNGIQTGLHYPVPVHLQHAHIDLGYRAGDFPVAEEAARTRLSLPIYPEMSASQIEAVVCAMELDAYVG